MNGFSWQVMKMPHQQHENLLPQHDEMALQSGWITTFLTL